MHSELQFKIYWCNRFSAILFDFHQYVFYFSDRLLSSSSALPYEDMTADQFVNTRVDGKVFRIELNRPEKKNAYAWPVCIYRPRVFICSCPVFFLTYSYLFQ